MNTPRFARPQNVLTFADRDAFVAFLDQHHVPHWGWGEQNFVKLWNEILNGDAVWGTGDVFGEPHMPVRYLLTVSIKVRMKHPKLGLIALVERIRAYGFYVPRNHKDATISEKIHVYPDGTPAETPLSTITRCHREETGFILFPNELAFPRLEFESWTQPTRDTAMFVPAQYGVEADYSERSKYTGTKTCNQVAHYTQYLLPAHHQPGWQFDSGTGSLLEWRPVQETGPRPPIPIR